MDHLWRRLRKHADWLLRWALLPGDLLGFADHRRRTIWVDKWPP